MGPPQKAARGGGAAKVVQQKTKGSTSGKKLEDGRDDALQAVILADSFETRFHPFTLETPRCLLPLANTPLLDYTLQFLAMSGVADVYLYCGAFTGKIEEYIQSSKWAPAYGKSPFNVLEILRTSALSVGDALRDLDSRDLITGDFLLVHGDLVSNMTIDAALKNHRARKMQDKNAIMTMVLRSAGHDSHRTKSQGITPVFVINPKQNRCLHYEEMHPLQANKYLNIDPELLVDHAELGIRTDLIDCGIDICTPDVLALWAESFDYEIPRRHFLHGVLKDYELNGKTLHTEIVSDRYAARVANLQAYESVSRDVLGRWTYPLVPDSNLMAGQTYKLGKGRFSTETGVVLARACTIGKRCVLGNKTSIGDGSSVSNSILGRRCQIGKNVSIQNSYIWDDVVIEDGATVDRAIIASEAVISQGCIIRPGALISFGVRIGGGKEVAENVQITKFTRDKAEAEGEKNIQTQPAIVGQDGEGYEFKRDEDEDDELSIYNTNMFYRNSDLNISNESISTIASDLSDVSADPPRSRVSSFTSFSEDDENPNPSSEGFHHDAVAGLLDTLKEGGDFDSAKLEFMGLRLSNDATDHQVRRAMAVAFTKRIAQLVDANKMEASKAAAQTFSVPGAAQFLKDVAIGIARKEEDQSKFITCLQKDLVHRANGPVILAAISQRLYQMDVLEEAGFLKWWEAAESLGEKEDKEMRRVREKTGVFIEWLNQAESESSSDEEDKDEDCD